MQALLTDGRFKIDNNRVENLIRPIAISRKNSLFAGHNEGGIAWGRIASLIETCKINGIEPFAYLKSTPKTASTTCCRGTSSRQAKPSVGSSDHLQ